MAAKTPRFGEGGNIATFLDRQTMKDGIQIVIASDDEHEHVFAEIYWDDKFVALVSQEEESLVVETPGPGHFEPAISRAMPLEEFRSAIDAAAKRLVG